MRVSSSGRLHVGREAPAEAREEALLDAVDVACGGAVGREHDLLAALVQLVEDVEELFLRLLLAAEELHVVHDEQVDLPVKHRELADALVVLDGLHELGREALRGDVERRV